MQVTTERRARAEPREPRGRWLPAVAVIVVLAMAGAGVWLITSDGERTATDVIQDLAKALRTDDAVLLNEVSSGDNLWFLEWQIALRAEPEYTNCSELAIVTGETRVACDVTLGSEFFYSQVLNEPFVGTLAGFVDEEGTFRGTDFPPPTGVDTGTSIVAIEAELRTWVKDAYPELEDELFGFPGYLGIKMTRESGELRMQLLDEFIASRS